MKYYMSDWEDVDQNYFDSIARLKNITRLKNINGETSDHSSF